MPEPEDLLLPVRVAKIPALGLDLPGLGDVIAYLTRSRGSCITLDVRQHTIMIDHTVPMGYGEPPYKNLRMIEIDRLNKAPEALHSELSILADGLRATIPQNPLPKKGLE